MSNTKLITTDPKHEALYQDMCNVFRKYSKDMTAIEILSISANIVGKLLAFQDQRTITPAMGLELVVKNIEEGNAQALRGLDNPLGSG